MDKTYEGRRIQPYEKHPAWNGRDDTKPCNSTNNIKKENQNNNNDYENTNNSFWEELEKK